MENEIRLTFESKYLWIFLGCIVLATLPVFLCNWAGYSCSMIEILLYSINASNYALK
jgi:hypothetical protein